ncbi:MAG: hypothetical protein Q4A06_05145 [Cardiobacteriaceae bacterium]|nr:hypothetical protein [Cardiobacteriaceae bacterium]
MKIMMLGFACGSPPTCISVLVVADLAVNGKKQWSEALIMMIFYHMKRLLMVKKRLFSGIKKRGVPRFFALLAAISPDSCQSVGRSR